MLFRSKLATALSYRISAQLFSTESRFVSHVLYFVTDKFNGFQFALPLCEPPHRYLSATEPQISRITK